ncbi:DUF1279 domain-containing protein [Lamellibrachia satsuma]|nr:DUF1279 domain-containing protein [Lamellibrachia satsuma]
MSGLISRLVCPSGGRAICAGRIAFPRAGIAGGWPKLEHTTGFHCSASPSFTNRRITDRHSLHRIYIGSLARVPIRNAATSHICSNVSAGPCNQQHARGYSAITGYSQPSQDDIPYPVTLKEHEYATFKEWFNNCTAFHLPGRLEQIHHLTDGDKSMSQVYAEQYILIERMVNDYQQHGLHVPPSETKFTAQGIQEGFGGVNVQPANDSNNPCPEGIQDLDCQSLRLYRELCEYYRFTDCEIQLDKLHSGEKSITDLLEDREKVLQGMVQYYNANASKTCDDSVSPAHEGATELSQMQRFKQMVKEYGTVVVVFHICISLMSLGICYTAVSSGFDLVSLINKFNLLPEDFNTKVVAGASTFVVAYAFHKMFVPVRMGITLASAPLIVRYLRRIGFMKVRKTK